MTGGLVGAPGPAPVAGFELRSPFAVHVPTALHLTETNAAYLSAKAGRGGHDLLLRSLERAAAPRLPAEPADPGTASR